MGGWHSGEDMEASTLAAAGTILAVLLASLWVFVLRTKRATHVTITELWCYPIKSCRGYRVSSVKADPTGFLWDRKFGLLSPEGKIMTQKKAPELATFRPRELDPSSGHLVIDADGVEPLSVPLDPSAEEVTAVKANWLSSRLPIDVLRYTASEEWIARALPKYAGCALVQMDNNCTRLLRNGRLAEVAYPEDACRLHDGAPMSVVSEASMQALNKRLKGKVTSERFRTNIVVSGCGAFEECTWTKLAVGASRVPIRPLMDGYRCTMATIDQHTGKRPNGIEVTKVLQSFRVVSEDTHGPVGSGLNGPLFAMFVTLDAPSANLSVGDTIHIEERLSAPSVYLHNKATVNAGLVQVPATDWGSGKFWESPREGPRIITPEELQEHSTQDNLWVVIDGDVYDVSGYEHPGGFEFLQGHANSDASAAFKKQGHSPTALDDVKARKVGELVTKKKKSASPTQGAATASAAAPLVQALDPSDLSAFMSTTDFEHTAQAVLDPGAHAYYKAGAEDDHTTAENERVWGDYLLRPRMFVDVTDVDLSTTVLGQHTLDVPMLAAPTALLMMAHERGEAGVAAACSAVGAGNCLSTTASMDIETVARAAPECYRWFQLYVYRDRVKTARLVQRAEAFGYSAIVLTVDLPVLGNRTSLKRIGFKVPSKFKMANMTSESKTAADLKAEEDGVNVKDPGDRQAYIKKLYDQNMSLDLIEWLATVTSLPVVIKGILRGADAARAAAYDNVKGVIVSNHGGRQLDGEIAPLTALPEVVQWMDRVNLERSGRGVAPVEVYVDGGVRRGRDVFKARALGAKAVLVGRPLIWGLAVGGDEGVQKVWELLREELKTCMQLAGVQSLDQIDKSFVACRSTVTLPSMDGEEVEDWFKRNFKPRAWAAVSEYNPMLEQGHESEGFRPPNWRVRVVEDEE
eukprot:TRINITY_DN2214_c0_g1_i2.p1 TRINITY_DN2214_c0_g1~~TRINITY_DN2214_c0_g1_i2.p1  ORF type:complete len:917 (-),score=206.96 TRINITY_DN2214_c0_g1_i2:208-2958(-)